jgi:Spy/CpxP family protein refolding chaperone
MRRLLLTVVLVGLVVAPVIAQRRPGGRGGMGMGNPFGPDGLLFNKSVQEELKLTDKQKSQLQAVQKKMMTGMRSAFKEAEGDREKMQELFKKNAETAQKGLAKVKDSLTTAQGKRFREIQVQRGGLAALNNPEVRKELKLTDKQKEQIKETLSDLRKDFEDLRKDAGGDREKMAAATKKMQKLTRDAMLKLVNSFTPEQKKAYKELRGEPFKFVPDAPFGGGGFRRPGADKKKEERKKEE